MPSPALLAARSAHPAAGGAPFDPSTISGLQGWWKADAITGLSDDDAVATWEDSSSANNDATQVTAGARPTYKTNALNGLPVVRTAAGDYMDLPAITLSAFSAFWVCTVDSKEAYGGPISLRMPSQPGFQVDSTSSTTTLRVQLHTYTGSAEANPKAENAAGVSLPVAAKVYSLVFDNAVAPVLYFDGVSQTLTVGEGGWINRNTICKGYAEQRGDYAEILVYDTNLGDPDRTDIEDYLQAKWATP